MEHSRKRPPDVEGFSTGHGFELRPARGAGPHDELTIEGDDPESVRGEPPAAALALGMLHEETSTK